LPVVENGNYRSENAEKYPRRFFDRRKSEFVRAMNLPRRNQASGDRD